MFDRAAAIQAARSVLDAAPRLSPAAEPIVDLGALVDAIVAAGSPDALVVPKYDAALAVWARYRLAEDAGEGTTTMSVVARTGAVAASVYEGERSVVAGLATIDMAWHLGLALCSTAMEAKSLRPEGE